MNKIITRGKLAQIERTWELIDIVMQTDYVTWAHVILSDQTWVIIMPAFKR